MGGGAQEPPARLLLLQPRWMGDVLLCTPAIRAARLAFPDARIDFVSEAAGAGVLRDNPWLDEVLVRDRSVAAQAALLLRVARGGYDAVVDFRSTNSTAQLAAVSRAPVRVGIRGRGPRNRAYTTLVDRLAPPTYAARHKLEMLAPLGVRVDHVDDLSLDLPLGSEHRDWARDFWDRHGLAGHRVLAVTPVSREGFKQWGLGRWAAVADALAADGTRVLVTHGPGEREQAAAVASAMSNPPLWDYATESVQQLGALLERCDAWVGNDGGAKHVAVAVGTPTLAVSRWQIGPVWTDPALPVPHRFIDHAPPQWCDLRCRDCAHRGCLAAIAERDVVAAARVALTRRR